MQAKSTTISEKIDLSSIPEEYHEYTKAETLAPHRDQTRKKVPSSGRNYLLLVQIQTENTKGIH